MLYRIARPLFFKMDPEHVHETVTKNLLRASKVPGMRAAMRASYHHEDPILRTKVWDLEFQNPVGIAAGFDKNAVLAPLLPDLGFGFVEIGTVTSAAQPGNPKPRMFRFPDDKALINRLGFNNEGAPAVAARLQKQGKPGVPLGVNIGKLKVVPNEEAVDDFLKTFTLLYPYGDYFVVNVSSPNTPGLRALQDRDHLTALIGALQKRRGEMAEAAKAPPRPLLVKVAPDLTDEQIDDVVAVATQFKLDGLIATNTTLSRQGLSVETKEAGGMSGAPLRDRAEEVLARIHRGTEGRIPLIGVGGILTAEDAFRRIRAGASLLQLYTGFIYGGPETAKTINKGLAERLRRMGYKSVQEAVGSQA
ncbi:MAG TPA: quinone-dependent dihydroorotate dehydrogenase [Candidatus Thermoplasmatota archaeon]|nr:quinone-dependent dihydroorotate dehydrogenase [Candidatus Thermoplasmatota archaeon]